MAPLRRGGKSGVFTLLVVYLVLLEVVQFWGARRGIHGWGALALLAPLVASALLPLRRTFTIGALTLATVGLYGLIARDLTLGGRILPLIAAACALALCVAAPHPRAGRPHL
ncbi:hypothetical protein RM780_05040 [Streptomyces sp. DSM 44917]|uniref:Histidine kinase n=1 Tax=Streptomyces boetiae TaxID=3075541 RepID=A0ABU2L4I2_9ACTN|nr:hypothetical protein [Streptomyces sp. DSM 44917]MDT0306326.1 hypothetical protein [Streptomyces sp. DSM 44917]